MQNYTRDQLEDSFKDEIFVGLDVDKASISVTVRDKYTTLKSLKMPYDSKNLLSFINKHYSASHVRYVYEAGPTGFGLYDDIVGAGHDCLVVSPGNIPSAPNKRVKTNRLDSKKLADLLCGDQLKGIRVPPESIRHLRSLVSLRYTYMQEIRAFKCRIKAELLLNGLKFPDAPKGSQWSKRVIGELRKIDAPAVISFKINSMLNHLELLAGEMQLVESAIKSHINGNEDLKRSIQYLMSCPGIGMRIACYVLARVGDWRCLGRSNEAGAFFGLVPTENSTGDRTDRGSITKCGDPRLRSMLIQGAWSAIRKDAELRALYNRICASHSVKVAARVAIVAVARKLAERMHCVLKHQRMYDLHVAA
jgi:Transposase and inactivated derivatives